MVSNNSGQAVLQPTFLTPPTNQPGVYVLVQTGTTQTQPSTTNDPGLFAVQGRPASPFRGQRPLKTRWPWKHDYRNKS
jgi:hypothetical protein